MTSIKKLTARGFKSFANKTELLFGDKFSVVLGPNGAGKSNVVDSISFVLGKSSAKEMRAEKSANLIFNGGKKGSPAKEAEVTIEFDNSEGKFPIQSKDVKITRIVKQNGTSIYKINDETRTRQQILDLLNGGKIDPDGHNIVLQGDIVSMAEMKPVERRMIIEEIAGISMYEEKKQKCLNELQKVDSKINEAEIILKEREINMRELKKERDQALKYKEIQETLRDDKATLIHLQIKDKEEKVNEIEKKKKEAEDKIEKVNTEINTIKQQIQTNKEDINKINNEVEVKGEKEQLVLRKEIEELKTVIVKANSRLEVCQNELGKIKVRKEQLNNNIKEVEDKIKELKTKRQEHEQQAKQVNSEEKELKINSIEERLNALKGDSKDIEALKNHKKTLKEVSESLIKSTSEDSSYALQINKVRQELYQNSEDLSKNKARQIGIEEKSLGDLAIRKILEQREKIKGIHGTVSSLGNVETRYSLALEVAAGPRINSIVVDTDVTAQKCIEHLKEHKLGTATFLPLNKIKSRVMESGVKELLNQKGVQGLAFDLVKHDSKYKDVFSYVFGSTVVVDDITTGRKLGIGRARMVTMEGDLMEPSGAMIGGYRTHKLGLGFKEKETNENIVKLEEEIKKQKTLLNHIESKRTSNEEIIKKLREEKANLEAEVIKLEKTLNIDAGTSNLMEEKKELQEEQNKYAKELNTTESKIKDLNKELDVIKAKKTKLKEKLADPNLAKNLEKLEEDRLKIKERSLEVAGNIKNLDTQITSMLMPEKEKTEKIIKQQDKEYEDFQKELNNVRELIKNREQELKVKENEEKKFYSNFKDLVNKRNKLTEKIQSLDANIAREEEKLKGHEQRLNSVNIDRAKAIAELEGLQKEFEPFKEAKIKRGQLADELKLKIRESERTLNNIGNVNLRALEVYDQIQEEYAKVLEKVSKLKLEKEDVLKMMAEIEGKKKEIFMKTYNSIIKNFKEIFGQLTTKGEAQVELENPENPFEAGVDIQVRVAGNKFLDIRSLSGGEKTLAALSLIFAIQEHDPSPFYLLDEVDAALDKRNS